MKRDIAKVTERIIERSRPTRERYLAEVEANIRPGPRRVRLTEGNLAHAAAACPLHAKQEILGANWPNIGIVTAYNDMLSAHQPFERFPDLIKHACRRAGATAQVAGGVPAMCDGVTQGQDGMELSLLSRDTIAMGTAVAYSHDTFDAMILLGVCDKIVPGQLIGALRFGFIPAIFAPAGPMPSGIPNPEKAKVRQRFAEGEATRAELLAAEAASYHSPGTCTFYGTANSNQMLMEIMGLQLPGSSFVQPNTPLRDAITAQTSKRAVEITNLRNDFTPIAHVVDEKAIVNGLVGLMATGGSTNLTIHINAIARAAGILIDWDDYEAISHATPLLAKVYPNGPADVNHFHAAGGMAFLIHELLEGGLLHPDTRTVAGDEGLAAYTREPIRNMHAEANTILYREGPTETSDPDVLAPIETPFRADGGLRVMVGDIGRGVMKVSAVKEENWFVEAPAVVIDHQDQLKVLHKAGELERDFVCVLRFQGPQANGMPELHALTPIFGAQMDKGYRVALVTDGRLSGASGKYPAAIHIHPEAKCGGNIGRIRDGDVVRVDPANNRVEVLADGWLDRELAEEPLHTNAGFLGMNMFAPMRNHSTNPEAGASFLGELA